MDMNNETTLIFVCSFGELLVMRGSLLESGELLFGKEPDVWVSAILMTNEQRSELLFFLKRISSSEDESESIPVSLPLEKWKGILRAVRLVSDRQNDVWDELDSRTGCAVDEFDAFAERLSAALMSIETPATTVEKST